MENGVNSAELQALLDYYEKEKGISREESYEIVQRNSAQVLDESKDFREAIGADEQVTSRLSASELDELFDHSYYVRFVDETFRRVGLG